MRIKKDEIMFIYDSSNHKEKEALAYAKALQYYHLRAQDLKHDSLTPTQVKRVAEHCNYKLEDLVDQRAAKDANFSLSDISKEELLTLLSENPELIKTPLVLWHDGGKQLENKFQLVNEGLKLNKKQVITQHKSTAQ